MTVYFRSCGALDEAPTPRSEKDRDLYRYITQRTGIEISIDASVDYEDWMEPVCLLEATLRLGLKIKILPAIDLRRAVLKPIATIEGKPCRDMLIGRQLRSDPMNFMYFDFGWPSKSGELANHYSELASFRRNAGRKLRLADMPGDREGAGDRKVVFPGGANSTPLGEAMLDFANGECIVKQVYPGKSLPLCTYEVGADTTEQDAEQMFFDDVGFHFARFEGDPAALLVQERVQMQHETRFFVINGKVVTAAACIEAHTPQQNRGDLFDLTFEVDRNKGDIIQSRPIGKKLWNFAKKVVQEIGEEAPEMQHYVIDLATGADGDPLVIELNPAAQSGLYAVHTKSMMQAIVEAAEAEPSRAPAYWDPEMVGERSTPLLAKIKKADLVGALSDDTPYQD